VVGPISGLVRRFDTIFDSMNLVWPKPIINTPPLVTLWGGGSNIKYTILIWRL
jgi:hypothetical protein